MTTMCLRRWSHAIESRTRYEHRRLRRVVRIVTWRGSRHVCFPFFPPLLPCLRRPFAPSFRSSARSSGHPGTSAFSVPRVVPLRAATRFLRQILTSQVRIGPPPARADSRKDRTPPRKRRHCRCQLARYQV